MVKKNVPTGVKILAVLSYIGAAFSLIGGLLAFAGGDLLGAMIPFASVLGAGIGIFMILVAVLQFFVGKGLWQGQNWARILVMIFMAFGILGGLMSLFGGAYGSGLFSLIIDGFIFWYLGFKEDVKKVFA